MTKEQFEALIELIAVVGHSEHYQSNDVDEAIEKSRKTLTAHSCLPELIKKWEEYQEEDAKQYKNVSFEDFMNWLSKLDNEI